MSWRTAARRDLPSAGSATGAKANGEQDGSPILGYSSHPDPPRVSAAEEGMDAVDPDGMAAEDLAASLRFGESMGEPGSILPGGEDKPEIEMQSFGGGGAGGGEEVKEDASRPSESSGCYAPGHPQFGTQQTPAKWVQRGTGDLGMPTGSQPGWRVDRGESVGTREAAAAMGVWVEPYEGPAPTMGGGGQPPRPAAAAGPVLSL